MALEESYHALTMADSNECPLCGNSMRLQTREVSDHIPGTGQTTTRTVREWICPECDYWEEDEGKK
jgi:C4-type Zn-finger protein